jgi:hypothetical protein
VRVYPAPRAYRQMLGERRLSSDGCPCLRGRVSPGIRLFRRGFDNLALCSLALSSLTLSARDKL